MFDKSKNKIPMYKVTPQVKEGGRPEESIPTFNKPFRGDMQKYPYKRFGVLLPFLFHYYTNPT
jgi:hypothetical protein